MNQMYAVAHLVPVVFYGILTCINATVRPNKQASIDGWLFALTMFFVAIVSGVLRVYQLDTWLPIWLLSLAMIAVLGFVTIIGAVIGTGMLVSYTSTTPVNSTSGWLTERREMIILSIGGWLSLLVLITDMFVLGGLIQQPM